MYCQLYDYMNIIKLYIAWNYIGFETQMTITSILLNCSNIILKKQHILSITSVHVNGINIYIFSYIFKHDNSI